MFDNADFGFYKVTIERPERLKAQFTEERIADLRYDKYLKEPMEWAYKQFGDKIYTDLNSHIDEVYAWAEQEGIELSTKHRKTLASTKTWNKHKKLIEAAEQLLQEIGTAEYVDFNLFSEKVKKAVKTHKIDCSATELKNILAAVSWYDETAKKVIKKKQKISGDKLKDLLTHLGCQESELPDFGYYPTGTKNEYITYETASDLRDYENIPLKERVHDYFLREVKPHVQESWIDLDKTKIGYEISFNKYFYQHKPLRPIEEVTQEILELEKESEGLIMDILKM